MNLNLPRYILCGSRSKLTDLPVETDWDFAAPNDIDTMAALEAQGFKKTKHSYFDNQTAVVYSKLQFDVNTFTNIQVALKKDFDLFVKVWDSITPSFFEKYIWKKSSTYKNWGINVTRDHIREIMNQLFEVAKNAN